MRLKKSNGEVPDSVTPGSLGRALNLVGDPWSLNILRQAFLGAQRFQDFQSRLDIPRQTLILRLKRLTDAELFYRKPVRHIRVIYEYHLTAKGLDLYNFVIMIWRWHSRWHLAESILPARLYHRNCGKLLAPEIRCASCHGSLDPESVEVRDGPGSGIDLDKPTRRARILNEHEKLGDDLLAIVVLGDCWSILVLNATLRGVQNYDAIQKALSISSNVLSSRLKTLLNLQLLEQERCSNDGRMYNYRPTDKARDIFPMILTLIHWGDRWLAGSEGPPDVLWHTDCGEILFPEVICGNCGDRLKATDVTLTPP